MRCLKVNVFVNATPDYDKQPEVANGASDLFVAVFGEAGRHARAAVGMGSLPRGVAVEVDARLRDPVTHEQSARLVTSAAEIGRARWNAFANPDGAGRAASFHALMNSSRRWRNPARPRAETGWQPAHLV